MQNILYVCKYKKYLFSLKMLRINIVISTILIQSILITFYKIQKNFMKVLKFLKLFLVKVLKFSHRKGNIASMIFTALSFLSSRKSNSTLFGYFWLYLLSIDSRKLLHVKISNGFLVNFSLIPK